MRLIFALFALAASPAAAQDYYGFQSPTGNIHCGIFAGEFAWARCDLVETTVMSFPTPPAECDLDWGHAFEVEATGAGKPACSGDTIADPANEVLGYGQSVSVAGFTCTSATTGMTCTNADGHGFTVRKGGQKVF